MKAIVFSQSLAAALCFVAVQSFAGPLQRADVPDQPAWVVHIDCDGLRPTGLGRFLMAEMEKPEPQAKFAAFQSIFSFDPRTQLHGLTLYSSGTASSDGVLLVYADFNPDRLVVLAKAAKEYQESTHKQHVIHSWIDAKRNRGGDSKARTYAAIHGGRVVVFGQMEERVGQALDVLDHTVPNLSTSAAFPTLGVVGASAFIQAAGRKLDLPASNPNAAMFRMSKAMSVQLGEAQGKVTASLVMEANDEQVAGHMTSIAQGLVALMKLQQDKPESVRLAESLSLKQDGARVLGSMEMPVDQVIELIKAHAARKTATKQTQ